MNELEKKQKKSKYKNVYSRMIKYNKYSEQNGKPKSADVRKKKLNGKKLKKDDFG